MMTLYSNFPSIDLHGFDREYARIMINEFIQDNFKLYQEKVIIVHGIGTGVLKKATQETLKRNRYVQEYKLDNFNSGATIVTLKKH